MSIPPVKCTSARPNKAINCVVLNVLILMECGKKLSLASSALLTTVLLLRNESNIPYIQSQRKGHEDDTE